MPRGVRRLWAAFAMLDRLGGRAAPLGPRKVGKLRLISQSDRQLRPVFRNCGNRTATPSAAWKGINRIL